MIELFELFFRGCRTVNDMLDKQTIEYYKSQPVKKQQEDWMFLLYDRGFDIGTCSHLIRHVFDADGVNQIERLRNEKERLD